MDPEFIREIFAGLDEHDVPIGGSFLDPVGNTAIPFLCETHPFIALYHPVQLNEETYRAASAWVQADANHTISDNAYLMKFASMAEWCDGNNYAPLKALPSVNLLIRHRIPKRLAKATEGFLSAVPTADEIYFIPGGDTEARTERLNLWYGRVSDRIAVEQLGLRPIHPTSGNYWYGYRKA